MGYLAVKYRYQLMGFVCGDYRLPVALSQPSVFIAVEASVGILSRGIDTQHRGIDIIRQRKKIEVPDMILDKIAGTDDIPDIMAFLGIEILRQSSRANAAAIE